MGEGGKGEEGGRMNMGEVRGEVAGKGARGVDILSCGCLCSVL